MSEASETKEAQIEVLYKIRLIGRDIEIIKEEMVENAADTKTHDRVLFRTMSNGDPSLTALVDASVRFQKWAKGVGSAVFVAVLIQLFFGGFSLFVQQRVEAQLKKNTAATTEIQRQLP